MLKRSLLAIGLLLAAGWVAAATVKHAVASAVEFGTGEHWQGQQYPGADAKGRLYLLRGSELATYAIDRRGKLGNGRPFEASHLDSPMPVLDAAMDRHGDWLVLHGNQPRWFRSGKEEPLPALNWQPSAVALVDGRPVVAVHPLPMGRLSRRELTRPPLLLAASESDWSVLVDSGLDGPPDLAQAMQLQQRSAARLFADAGDTLWLAHRYRYRVVHYSAAGRELTTLEVGGGAVKHRESDDPALERASESLEEERERYSDRQRTRPHVNSALTAVLDLTEGPDGRIYLLVEGVGESGATLDRFDEANGVLERTTLDLRAPGAVSIAAGRDGLFVVPFNGREARFLVPWSDLEAASWETVEDIVVDGSTG